MDGTTRPPNGPAEDEIDLREVVNLLLRNRWWIAGCLGFAVAVAIALTLRATPIYEAYTSIRIEEDRPDISVLNVLGALSRGSEVETEMEVMRSRTLAEGVVDSLGLQVIVISPRRIAREALLEVVDVSRAAPAALYVLERTGDGRFTVRNDTADTVLGTYAPGERIRLDGAAVVLAPAAAEHDEIRLGVARFEDAVDALRGLAGVSRPNRDADLVVVRYQSPDTVLVREVPNAMAVQFIARRHAVQKTEATSTVDFLREQIDTLETQLRVAEASLRAFREGEQVVSLEAQASTQVQQLAELQGDRERLDAERASLAGLLAETRATAAAAVDTSSASPFRRLIGFPALLRNQAASEMLRSLTAAENERANLLRRWTPRHPDVQVLTARIQELEQQLRAITVTYLDGLTRQVAALDATLARFGDELARIPAKEIQLARMQRQASVLAELYTVLQTRLKEAEIVQAVEDPSVRVVDPAITPAEPVKPRGLLNLMLGMVLGLMLGVGVAFLREFLDTAVHTREDVQEAARIPVLGLIPRIAEVHANGNGRYRPAKLAARKAATDHLEARLVTGRDPRNPASEAYRSLRTNLTFAQVERAPKTLVFTSASPGEGKSTSAANLAITLAQQGTNVLLIDADLRRGILNGVFGTDREPGLSNVLAGGTALEDAVRTLDLDSSGVLHFLPTGTIPPNPAELLGAARMRELLERLGRQHDIVILDAPPLTAVTDAAVLGSNVDGVLVVARAGRTPKGALTFAMDQLRHVRAPVLGAVLNDIDFNRDIKYHGSPGAYGYYRYGYGVEDAE